MFPLGTVLFPHALLPLRVFEPRYRLLAERVLRGGGDTRFDTGTVARVVRSQRLPDGGYLLGTVGIRRIRVTRWLPDDPYPQADVVAVEEPAASGDSAGARDRAVAALDDLCAIYRERDPRVPEVPAVADDAEQASYEL